jgi:hypothetical protein
MPPRRRLGAESAFEHALVSLTYGEAVAIDAAGQRLPVYCEGPGSGMVVTVSSSFVAKGAATSARSISGLARGGARGRCA